MVLLHIYTHRFSLTHLLFLLCPISIHLSIRKLSLQAKWLPDDHLCEDFFKGQGHILINSIESTCLLRLNSAFFNLQKDNM